MVTQRIIWQAAARLKPVAGLMKARKRTASSVLLLSAAAILAATDAHGQATTTTGGGPSLPTCKVAPTFEDTFRNGLSQWQYNDSQDSCGFGAPSWELNPNCNPTSDPPLTTGADGADLRVMPTPADLQGSISAPYVGSWIGTANTFSQTYGYFEMNAELPQGPGVNPAFWMMPYNSWPPEIDIVEMPSGAGPDIAFQTAHSLTFGGTESTGAHVDNPDTEYHTYAIDWEPTTTTWYVDGVQTFQIATPSDWNQPFYLLLDNLAGDPGSWEGGYEGGTSDMKVNYVRAFPSNPYLDGSCTPPAVVAGAPACSATTIAPIALSGGLDGLPQIIAGAQTTESIVAAQIAAFSGTPDQNTALQGDLAGLNADIQALQNLQTAANGLPANATPAQVAALQDQLTNVLTSMADHKEAIDIAIQSLDKVKDACLIRILNNIYGPITPAVTQGTSGSGSGLIGLIGNILGALGISTAPDMSTALDDLTHLSAVDNAISGNYITGLQGMTEQLTTVMMQQALIIGTFMDAQDQLETQRMLQDMDAQAAKEYEPSTEMCIIGTNTRSLAMSDQKGKANAYILSNAMLNRSMLSHDQEGGESKQDDMVSRIAQYESTYCNPKDNAGMLGNMTSEQFFCKTNGGPQDRRNRDIDFTGVVDGPLTLDVDFTDGTLTHDEEDVLAMSRNLFSSDLVDYIPADLLTQGPVTNMGPGAWVFQNWRSLEAIRGVAQNSFAHLVGMKAKGGSQVYPFMAQIMKGMGVPDADLQNYLSPVAPDGTNAALNATNPSYFAQMDVLTKRLYMDPKFYTNLFTQPANVERVGVTLQAIKLMNDRDRFEASQRREMLISLIVEMKLRDQERDTENGLLGSLPSLYLQ